MVRGRCLHWRVAWARSGMMSGSPARHGPRTVISAARDKGRCDGTKCPLTRSRTQASAPWPTLSVPPLLRTVSGPCAVGFRSFCCCLELPARRLPARRTPRPMPLWREWPRPGARRNAVTHRVYLCRHPGPRCSTAALAQGRQGTAWRSAHLTPIATLLGTSPRMPGARQRMRCSRRGSAPRRMGGLTAALMVRPRRRCLRRSARMTMGRPRRATRCRR
ncbi:hypothetical protein MXAN_1172 [Myxococcus xanthus DK 1622]|uniref:Uncharacterized protein n=1 Tax=Myxococcus xanthus (strain DK1622) TaxID=246197 RepID=Q1DD41_MYXXD|nr:hypothetical protein MXAN_1172 [Myxococcus xanthus DK 1622]